MSRKHTVVDVLKIAKSRIENPMTWIKGAFIKRLTKEQIEAVGGNYKTAYCAIGAIRSVTLNPILRSQAYEILSNNVPRETDVEIYNDEARTKHEDIMRLFDKAIKQAEKEEANAR